MKCTRAVLFAMAALLALAQTASAGTPLICHSLDIGNAESLPWSDDGWNLSGKVDYDRSHLVADTLALLTPSTPVIVRMETLRRATIYANQDPRIAKELLIRLRARALDAEKDGRPDPLAWFDAGYLVECYHQANLSFRRLDSGGWEPVIQPNAASNVDGYAWVKKAINLRGEDAEMEFAAALITSLGPAELQSHRSEHVNKAMAAAGSDPLLAVNLNRAYFNNRGEKVAHVLTKVETAYK